MEDIKEEVVVDTKGFIKFFFESIAVNKGEVDIAIIGVFVSFFVVINDFMVFFGDNTNLGDTKDDEDGRCCCCWL
jgi:hypothetical protein